MPKVLLRFAHLKERHIIESWPQLKRLVETENFPPGRLLGPNTRVWFESEIDAWLKARPTTRKKRIAA